MIIIIIIYAAFIVLLTNNEIPNCYSSNKTKNEQIQLY